MEMLLEKTEKAKGIEKFESGPNPDLKTIASIIEYRAATEPEKEAFTYLLDGDDEIVNWNYRDLKNAVAQVSETLNENIESGDRVLLLFEPGLSFIAAYLATVSSGAIAVPCHPPMGSRQVKRLLDMIQNCQPSLILYSDLIANTAPQLKQFAMVAEQMGINLVSIDVLAKPKERKWIRPELGLDDLAMLQYTSASTGDPKGVMVTQDNLVKNCDAIYTWLGKHDPRKGCIWLPPYHDMGLLGGIMQPLYAGFPLVFMSPMHFVQKPLRWLKAISDYRLTTTGAPNFAFQLCVDDISDEDLEAANLDLSCAREIFCGSEPINPATIKAFYERFKHYGLPETSANPCYGLAEATLFVSGKPMDTVVKTEYFDSSALDLGQAKPLSKDEEGSRAIVSCGLDGHGLDIKVVNTEIREAVPEGEVGEIWVSGGSVTKGYWCNDELTNTAFNNDLPGTEGGYYRTGDLGFYFENELYVTGRIKEVVIIRGRNLYPQDIERCALDASPVLDKSIAAAFAVQGEDTEHLIVVIAVRSDLRAEARTEIKSKISAAIANEFNVVPDYIHIGPRKTIPRTTSGKIQRGACRDYYLKNNLMKFSDEGAE